MPDDKSLSEVQSHEDSPTAQVPNAQLRDKRKLPEGVVPKQAQSYVVAGLAVLILMAVMFSKNPPRPAAKATPATPAVTSTDVNQRRIQELEQDLSAQQRQAVTQRASAATSLAGTTPVMNAAQPGATAPASQLPPTVAAQPAEPPRDPIADAEKEMAFKARFASNLVGPTDAGARSSSADPAHCANSFQVPATQYTSTPSPANNKRAPEVNINSAHGQPFAVFEGTTIDAVLINRLDGEFVGQVKVMVANPVYSENRQHVLIPEGTFILGDTQKVSSLGQKRLAITFHRMLMPDKYSVDLDQFAGLDQAGETGIKGKINNHYMEIFGASIALGVITGAAEATTNNGYNETGSDAYRQGIASSLSQSGANVLDRFINILPTHIIFEGHRIKVYITQDMLLPAYENHDMPEVF